jgi:hypothetical protein
VLRVVWYQHRNALLGLSAVLTVMAAGLLATGWAARAHHPVQFGVASFGPLPISVPTAIAAVFALTGMLLGAPLLGREYEQGTFRFAWTQGTGRMRWCAGQLNLLGGLIVLAAAGTGALASWALSPYSPAGASGIWLRAQFGVSPTLTAGLALLAFLLGVLAGAVIKRVMPAVAATAVALIILFGWYRSYSFGIIQRPPGQRPWSPTTLGLGLLVVALLAEVAALWLVRSRGARTRGRPPEPG